LTINSKRDGLEKAVYRIEQALKRSKTQGSQSEDDRNAAQLQSLLTEAQSLLPLNTPAQHGEISRNGEIASPSQNHFDPQFGHLTTEQAVGQSGDDHFEVDDAENPLQLLARASDLSATSNTPSFVPNMAAHIALARPVSVVRDQQLQDFFGPFRPSLDFGPDIDPIELGLVTEEEAAALFI
jgi:hypothetical protein